MGLSAGQARLFVLTMRQMDVELRGQTINNRRMAISYTLEKIAQDYSRGISNKNIMLQTTTGLEKASYANMTDAGYSIKDRDGVAVSDAISSDDLELGLRSGKFALTQDVAASTVDGIATSAGTETVDWRASSSIQDVLDTSDDEQVMAEYEYKSAQVQGQDKRLEVELKQLDSEHKEIDTEVETVKKVIDKNIERAFKTFG